MEICYKFSEIIRPCEGSFAKNKKNVKNKMEEFEGDVKKLSEKFNASLREI